MQNKVSRILGVILCCAISIGSFASDFYDGYISAIKEAGIMQGYPDGTFGPDKAINRAEFTKTIIAAMYTTDSINKCSSRILHFTDIEKEAWYIPYLCIAYNENIIEGYPDGTFRPADTISAAEASVILTRTFRLQQDGGETWYDGAIQTLKGIGAYPPTATSPENLFLRKELAFSIANLLKMHAEGTMSYTQFLQTNIIDEAPIDEMKLLNMLNGERRAQGLPEVTINQKLNDVSQKYAERMAEKQFFSHTDINGDTTHERLVDGNYEYFSYGENIGIGQRTEQEIMRWWIASPGHYENIIRDGFTEVGFGKAKVSPEQAEYSSGYYWVNTFGSPR